MQTRQLMARRFWPVLSLCLTLAFPFGAASQNITRIQIGDLWDSPDGLESPIGLQGLYFVWPGGGEKASSLYEGGFRTNSTGARFRPMFKDYEYEVKDSLGNIIEKRTIPYYHPSWALRTPTEAYRPTQVKWMRSYRGPTTVIYEDGTSHQNTVDPQGQYLIERGTLNCDEMIEYTEYFSDGFYVKQSYYAWANPFHDDYIIRVVDIVNNGNTDNVIFTSEMPPKDLKRLYFDLYVNNLSPNNKGEGYYSYDATGQWDNWHDYYGDTQSDSLRFMYAFDGDDPSVPGDDQGDPYPVQFASTDYDPDALYSGGEFISAMYAAYGVLHTDFSTTNHQNDLSQPFAYSYDNFTLAPGWREELRWVNVFKTGQRGFKHPDYNQPVQQNLEACWMSFGPYDLPPFGSLRIVLVHAINGPSIQACKEMGRKYANGEITKAEKDAFLRSAMDSLKTTIRRATWNYQNYLSKNRSMPNAPKPPTKLVIESRTNTIALQWEASKSTDVATYIIYRKAGNNFGECTRVGEVDGSSTTYVDSLLNLGVSYYYYVTAATDGSTNTDPTCFGAPLESSKFFNRSYHPARAFRAASTSLTNVRVVPNPYNYFQARTFPGDPDRLTFTNLTKHCIVRVFTVNGDLVKTLTKNDPSSYITWSPMLTDDNLFIAPDIYIFYVEDLDTGEKARGKFIVVR